MSKQSSCNETVKNLTMDVVTVSNWSRPVYDQIPAKSRVTIQSV
jgi:hypothetical protein